MSLGATTTGLLGRLLEPGFARRLLIAELTIGALLLWRGIELGDDSASYLEGAAYREPLYPLFLDLLEAIFGGGALFAVLVLQVAFGLLAAGALLRYLHRALPLPEWLAWTGFALILALPYLGPPTVASRVLSLALAYPLFLLVMRWLMAAMIEVELRPFAYASGYAAALVLCRLQFLFVFPILAVAASLWLIRRSSRRRGLLAMALVAAVFAGTTLCDRGYRLLRHGTFASAPFVGLQLLAGALYVAPESAVSDLPAEHRELFVSLHRAASERGLLASANPSPGGIGSYAWHYRQNYNEIVWRLIMPELHRADRQAEGEDWFAVEGKLLPLALALMSAEPAAFLRLVLSNFLSGLGFYHAILLLIITPALLLSGLRRRDGVQLAAGMVVLTHLANCTLVALVEPLKLRYSFHASGLVVIVLIALAFEPLQRLRPLEPPARRSQP